MGLHGVGQVLSPQRMLMDFGVMCFFLLNTWHMELFSFNHSTLLPIMMRHAKVTDWLLVSKIVQNEKPIFKILCFFLKKNIPHFLFPPLWQYKAIPANVNCMFPYYRVFDTCTLSRLKYCSFFFFQGPKNCEMNPLTKMGGGLYSIWGNKRPSPEIQLLLVRIWQSLNYYSIPAK